ncbi:cbb3-type cytochrome oxidase subunit 3 [Altererythrobacter litoralis]|uniref:Cbb3-type cytochrome c oxidase subunit 3 n=1 Tax=Altererythrobacter litoralis TaxID=3113904 RepID=A0ABU7GDA7_9SPHN|nr:cbb3-type cytochrome c oxidase subunit 3 [Erythrobacteraceae bacterium 1XM1-14]
MSDYNTWRHFADSYGLLTMMVLFLVLCAWLFRPGAKHRNDEAAHSILKDHDDGE